VVACQNMRRLLPFDCMIIPCSMRKGPKSAKAQGAAVLGRHTYSDSMPAKCACALWKHCSRSLSPIPVTRNTEAK
jgi:hypothetical protein